ncbi:MAG: bifunctional oligoribonuclease/PAP phosphatase NrnA [Lachnospiraceae bacterium]|nr:bifunctional oligoribonuclease/PAP phosphatase NrnA [Lachnospiraceae bacterium]
MNLKLKKTILSEIKAAETIIISRHKRPDGDAVGSTMGLAEILRASFPDKRIFLDNEDYAEFTAFLGDEGPHPTDADYENALVIVIDTGTLDRISNKRVTNGKTLIKIDHHIDKLPYGDLSWVEEERSSACEMIVGFYQTFPKELTLNERAATCLYTGMVTDSGRFKYRGTSADTMRCAATLLERNIDTEMIHANLYMEEFRIILFEASLTKRIQRSGNGVAWLYITRALRKRHGLTLEEASNVVSLMDAIKGSLIWLAFIENDDESIRVRLRSRFVEVEALAGAYHGGGHACASGATVYSKEEAMALLADADKLLGEYKAEHPECL